MRAQGGRAAALVIAPLLEQVLEPQDCRILRVVALETPPLQRILVELEDGSGERPPWLGVLGRVERLFAHAKEVIGDR